MTDTRAVEGVRFWRIPLDAGQIAAPVGEVVTIPERCKGCGWCIEFCPKEVLSSSTAFNSKGYFYPVVATPENCVDCRLCERICPDFAIYLRRSFA